VDADLHVACEADAKKLCADVNPGEGRVQDCLRDKAVRVSGECQEELFRQEVENADDLRLSHRLFRKCNGDKNRFCPDVKYGAAAAPGSPPPAPCPPDGPFSCAQSQRGRRGSAGRGRIALGGPGRPREPGSAEGTGGQGAAQAARA